MKFLYPEFLWALLAIAIPIVIHLFNFRKFKKVEFSSIAFLKEVEFQTQKQSKLKHLILLFVRILAVTFLVLAFAQPYVPFNEQETQLSNLVTVYIDNSLSMDTKGENGYHLELAKEQAISIANEYSPSDKFILLTNDFEGKHQRAVNRDQFTQFVEDIAPSYTTRMFSEVVTRSNDLMNESASKKSTFILSDFQKNITNIESTSPDSNVTYQLLPYPQAGKGNIYLDSVWFETPLRAANGDDAIYVHINNDFDQTISTKVNLEINGRTEGFGNFTIEGNSDFTGKINFKVKEKGWQNARVYLSDYPNPDMLFDDEFYFSYPILEKVNILYLYEELSNKKDTTFITNLFDNDSLFEVHSASLSSFDINQMQQYNFVILSHIKNFTSGLNSTLENYISNGGSVLLFPEVYSIQQNEFLGNFKLALNPLDTTNNKLGKLNDENPLYQGVFEQIPKNINLPIAYSHFPIKVYNASSANTLLQFQSGSPFLISSQLDKGKLYLCASSLDKEATNFMKHAIYVPTLIRMAEFSQPSYQLYYTIGTDENIALPNIINNTGEDKLIVKEINSDFEFIPEIASSGNATNIKMHNQIKDAGFYEIFSNGEVISQLAYNYDRKESDWKFFTIDEINDELSKSEFGEFAQVISGAEGSQPVSVSNIVSGEKYWRIALIIVLILLALEIAIFRLWKN